MITLILLITLLGIPLDRYPLGNSSLRMLYGASTIPYCPKSNRKSSNLQLLKTAGFKPCKTKSMNLIDWTYGTLVPLTVHTVPMINALKWIYKEKLDDMVNVLKKKGTFCTKGFRHEEGLDLETPLPRCSGIFINQAKYANEILKKFDLHKSDPDDTPMVVRTRLEKYNWQFLSSLEI
ncbi:hypothetical protein Tco_1048442, partial [Tanacetum coccineum]